MDEPIRTTGIAKRLRRSGIDVLVLSVAGTLLLLQGFRVFIPYLVFEIDQSERARLATIALAVFALAFLAAPLYRLIGGRLTLSVAAAMLIVARMGIQFTENPEMRWLLGAGTVVAWSWVLTVLLPYRGPQCAAGIGISFVLDLCIRGARGTLDLPWMPGNFSHLVTIVIALVLAFSTWSVLTFATLDGDETTYGSSVRYLGIGSGIALWLVAAGNLGFAEVRGGLGLAAAFGLLTAGSLLALALPTVLQRNRFPIRNDRAISIFLGALGLLSVFAWERGVARWFDILLLPVLSLVTTLLTMSAAITTGGSPVAGRWRCGAALTIGLLLQTAFTFAYFARSGPLLLLALPILVLILAGLAGTQVTGTVSLLRPALKRGMAVLAITCVLVFAWILIDQRDSSSSNPDPGQLTVMTFNIQGGFSNGNIWSLEEIAQTIESNNPDIVLIQEITRGWMVMSSVDQVRWLSDRLQMDYAYSGNSYDGLWGNAILTRLPILSTDSVVYSTTDNLRRGAVSVDVETLGGSVRVIDTHLDNPGEATEVRLAQIAELIELLGSSTPAIVAGDFNADSGSPEWQAIIDAGLVDAAADDATTTSEDARRIDYIFLTPDLSVSTYAVPEIWTSDHRPVVVELSLSS